MTVIEISAVIGIVVWAAGYRLIRVSKRKEHEIKTGAKKSEK